MPIPHFNTGRVRALLPGETPRPEVGDKFGRLTITAKADNKGKYKCWQVLCSCGAAKVVYDSSLRLGRTTSCGCLAKEVVTARVTVHGQCAKGKQSKTYKAWADMRQRCDNVGHGSYINYGARGISYDPRWVDFSAFLEDMGEAPRGLTLERVENSSGYCKSNCKWATYKEQLNNTRRNHVIAFEGVSRNITQWAEHLGIKTQTLRARLNRGDSLEKALSSRVHPRKPNTPKDGND